MTSRAQLHRAISDRIKTEFTNVPIQGSDVEEGFERPSFFFELETNTSDTGQYAMRRDFTCRILFFPSDRHVYEEEVCDVQDRLEKLFGLNFMAAGRAITVDTAETFVLDKIMHYDFDFSFYVDVGQEEAGAKMEELRYHG